MNTKDTPFALSFGNYGDPRRYMGGASPGKKVEQAVAKIRNSPIAGLMGLGLAGGQTTPAPTPTPTPAAPALGQGVAVPVAPPLSVNPNAPGGIGIPPGSFQIPNLTLPQIASPISQGQDLDGDGQIDNFWGLNK